MAFIAGFATKIAATRAGARFTQQTDGTLGRADSDFHVIQNGQGRWSFETGKRPSTSRPGPKS